MLSTLQRIFLIILIGILLIMIGGGVDNDWLCLVGSFLFAVSLIWGGLFIKEEGIPIRVTMLAIAGITVFSMISSGGLISSLAY